MKDQITINKEWYKQLVKHLDKVYEKLEHDDHTIVNHAIFLTSLAELKGYIQSLDMYFKDEIKNKCQEITPEKLREAVRQEKF